MRIEPKEGSNVIVLVTGSQSCCDPSSVGYWVTVPWQGPCPRWRHESGRPVAQEPFYKHKAGQSLPPICLL